MSGRGGGWRGGRRGRGRNGQRGGASQPQGGQQPQDVMGMGNSDMGVMGGSPMGMMNSPMGMGAMNSPMMGMGMMNNNMMRMSMMNNGMHMGMMPLGAGMGMNSNMMGMGMMNPMMMHNMGMGMSNNMMMMNNMGMGMGMQNAPGGQQAPGTRVWDPAATMPSQSPKQSSHQGVWSQQGPRRGGGRVGGQQGTGRSAMSPRSGSSQTTAAARPKPPALPPAKEVLPSSPARAWTASELEEARQWREERRKHYPTASNVAKKGEEASRRVERGQPEEDAKTLRQKRLQQVLEKQRALGLDKAAGTADMMRSLWTKGGQRGRGRGRGRGGREQGGRHQQSGRGYGSGDSSSLLAGSKRPMDSDTVPSSRPATKQRQEPEQGADVSDGLQLLCGYGSDSDTNVEEAAGKAEPVEVQAQGQDSYQPPPPQAAQGTTRQLSFNGGHNAGRGRGRGQQGEQGRGRGRGRGRHSERGGGRATGRGRGRDRGRGNRPSQIRQHQPRAPSLLSKLLTSEVKRDHSHLLQAFRFLVNNNFLADMDTTPLVFPEEKKAGDKPLELPNPEDVDIDLSDNDEMGIADGQPTGGGDATVTEQEEPERSESVASSNCSDSDEEDGPAAAPQ